MLGIYFSQTVGEAISCSDSCLMHLSNPFSKRNRAPSYDEFHYEAVVINNYMADKMGGVVIKLKTVLFRTKRNRDVMHGGEQDKGWSVPGHR